MINFNENDVNAKVAVWIDVLKRIEGSSVLDCIEMEVWDIARVEDEIPHIGNIYLQLIASKLTCALESNYPEIETSYYINALDSHFYLDGERLTDISDFDNLVAEMVAEEVEE